jgi:hypothetical protein
MINVFQARSRGWGCSFPLFKDRERRARECCFPAVCCCTMGAEQLCSCAKGPGAAVVRWLPEQQILDVLQLESGHKRSSTISLPDTNIHRNELRHGILRAQSVDKRYPFPIQTCKGYLTSFSAELLKWSKGHKWRNVRTLGNANLLRKYTSFARERGTVLKIYGNTVIF